MHFVHIEDFFHPDAGYQVNLLSRLQVKQGHKVTIVTSEFKKIPEIWTSFFGLEKIDEKDKNFTLRNNVEIVRLPLLGYYSGRSIYYPKIFKVVDSLNPDVLFIHGEDTLIGIQYLLKYSKLKHPLVLDCHMLEMASINKFRKLFRIFYKNLISPIIIKNAIPLIRVVDSDYVEKCLGIPLAKTTLLSFGTDTDYFRPNEENRRTFRAKHGIKLDDFVVLYAGKLDFSKGGFFLAESLKEKVISTTSKNIVFIVVGTVVGDYGKRVENLFKESENRIIRFPTQPYINLVDFYQAADIAVFPKQCSLSFFEVQSCELPVVIEDNEINTPRINFGNGLIFLPENIQDFRNKIIDFVEMDSFRLDSFKFNSRKYVLDKFDYIPIAQKFTDVMINEFSKRKYKTDELVN